MRVSVDWQRLILASFGAGAVFLLSAWSFPTVRGWPQTLAYLQAHWWQPIAMVAMFLAMDAWDLFRELRKLPAQHKAADPTPTPERQSKLEGRFKLLMRK